MLDVVLYQPEIPPNTGNIMRLCANTGSRLHLIHPLGFQLEDQLLRRAGLDYREWADVAEHGSFTDWITSTEGRILAFTRNASRSYATLEYRPGDSLLFGPESDGLPADVLAHGAISITARIPMVERSRSLNLSNAVSIVVYEALRQHGFPGLTTEGK